MAGGPTSGIDECLYKAPGARPSPANAVARLESLDLSNHVPGLQALAEVNRVVVAETAERQRDDSEARSSAERRDLLLRAAQASFEAVSAELRTALGEAAPAARVESSSPGRAGWKLRLGDATLMVSATTPCSADPWNWEVPAFEVIAYAEVNLRIPATNHQYEGRAHSLWYCDAVEQDRFGWYETAFMISPMIPQRGRQNPFALPPGEDAAKAVWSGMAEFQVAWPFTPLFPGTLGDFIDRWGAWLAAAAAGRLSHPSRMPERDVEGSWRRN